MIFYLTARIVSSVAAFLYPGYASYKTLSQRPASEEELERWLMYWSVLGCLIGVEYLAEWLVSWIPFYYTLKMLFLLYLALPQTRGSSYIYTTHLQPFFHAHETQIDAALASLKARAYAFVQDRLRALWDAAAAAASLQQAQSQAGNQNPAGTTTGTAAPPSLADPVSGPAQLVGTLWRSYGPGIMASGAAFLRSAATTVAPSTRPAGAAAAAGGAFNTPPSSVFRGDAGGNASTSTMQSVLERKQQLEAELAALSSDAELAALQASSSSSGHLIPPASNNNNNNRRRGTDGVGLRERTYSNAGSGGSGRFEEVEVPSDVEGYDIGDAVVGVGEGEGHDVRAGTVTTAARGSWFGWGAGKGEYERVKSE